MTSATLTVVNVGSEMEGEVANVVHIINRITQQLFLHRDIILPCCLHKLLLQLYCVTIKGHSHSHSLTQYHAKKIAILNFVPLSGKGRHPLH